MTIIFPFLLVMLLFNTLLINVDIPTGSMESTIMPGSRAFGSRMYYWNHDPQRGDITVFKDPDDNMILLTKRLIGMPGDHIKITQDGVFINGEKLDEPYLNEKMIVENDLEFDVPDGSYFFMGDNRNHSWDARY